MKDASVVSSRALAVELKVRSSKKFYQKSVDAEPKRAAKRKPASTEDDNPEPKKPKPSKNKSKDKKSKKDKKAK